MANVTRYCNKCILPDTYHGISFNGEGVCNYCVEYSPIPPNLGKEELLTLIHSQSKKGPYDCVVPVSGGKDSTFILYYIVRELRLNPIAVNYDSGFQTHMARKNVENACRILGVQRETVKAPDETQSKLLKQWIQLAGKLGGFYGNCGGNCEAILRYAAINTARSHGVPFVIWGSSAIESGSYERYLNIGKQENYGAALLSSIKGVVSRLNSLIKHLGKARKIPAIAYSYIGYHAIMFRLTCIYQRLKIGFPYKHALRPQYVPPFTHRDPMFVHFFNYISWDSINTAEILKNELKWTHPEGRDTRFDCLIHCLLNFECLNFYGITGDGANFCKFIRAGKLDREAAEKSEKIMASSIDDEVEELLERVGLKGFKGLPKSLEYQKKYGAF